MYLLNASHLAISQDINMSTYAAMHFVLIILFSKLVKLKITMPFLG